MVLKTMISLETRSGDGVPSIEEVTIAMRIIGIQSGSRTKKRGRRGHRGIGRGLEMEKGLIGIVIGVVRIIEIGKRGMRKGETVIEIRKGLGKRCKSGSRSERHQNERDENDRARSRDRELREKEREKE